MHLARFIVRFRSRCTKCQDPIEEGDTAAYSREEPGQILCDHCATEEEEDA